MPVMELLSTNSGSKLLRERRELVIVGSCLIAEWPDLVNSICEETICLSACPERDHINVISLKLASILSRVKLEKITVLTVDGSPHCLQLHHALEEAMKVTGSGSEVRHMVIYKGKLFEIARKSVRYARYLYKINKLIENQEDSSSIMEPSSEP